MISFLFLTGVMGSSNIPIMSVYIHIFIICFYYYCVCISAIYQQFNQISSLIGGP